MDGAITDAAATSGITLADSTVSFLLQEHPMFKLIQKRFLIPASVVSVLTGVTRGVRNTTAATHSDGATITNTTDYVGWGEAASGDKVFDPGMWSLDNYGTTLIALIFNGPCFQWDSTATSATSTRATIISNAPTASRDMLVSTPDRHLVFFGTETTIGDTTTQDDMFIRFSSQEDITDYTPTAINTAGTQRLADGSKIMGSLRGRDAIYIWTDTAMFTMRFVGSPFHLRLRTSREPTAV